MSNLLDWKKALDSALSSNKVIDEFGKITDKGDYPTLDDDLNKLGKDAERIDPFDKPGNWKSQFEEEEDEYEKKQNKDFPLQENSLNYWNSFFQNNNSSENILYKDISNITENEILHARKFANYDTKDIGLKNSLNKKINQWYDDIYGNNPIKYDITGRMVTPNEKLPAAKNFVPLKSKDGLPIGVAFQNISQTLSDTSAPLNILSLQKSINQLLNSDSLKEDGVIGPKTTSATKKVLATLGFSPLLNQLRKNM